MAQTFIFSKHLTFFIFMRYLIKYPTLFHFIQQYNVVHFTPHKHQWTRAFTLALQLHYDELIDWHYDAWPTSFFLSLAALERSYTLSTASVCSPPVPRHCMPRAGMILSNLGSYITHIKYHSHLHNIHVLAHVEIWQIWDIITCFSYPLIFIMTNLVTMTVYPSNLVIKHLYIYALCANGKCITQ